MQQSLRQWIDLFICPYCHGALVARNQYLICRYHQIGFRYSDHSIDFTWENAKRSVDFASVKSISFSSDIQNKSTDTL